MDYLAVEKPADGARHGWPATNLATQVLDSWCRESAEKHFLNS
jgi:hypothetical protein